MMSHKQSEKTLTFESGLLWLLLSGYPVFFQFTEITKVDPLRDVRVTKQLQDLGMQDCSITLWSFGQEGDEDHKLLEPHSICTNRKGHFIVSDYRANEIKVFDKGGKFLKKFRTPSPTHVCDVVTDRNGNIYTLSYLLKREANEMEYTTELTLTVYDKETHSQPKSSQLPVKRNWCGFNELHSYLAVSDSNKVFLLNGIRGEKTRGGYRVNYLVDVYSTDGQFVCSFGEEKIKSASAIVTDNDSRVMILEMSSVRVFSEQGDQIFGFSIDGPGPSEESKIAFHRESEYVVIVQKDRIKDILRVQIYAKKWQVRAGNLPERGKNSLGTGNDSDRRWTRCYKLRGSKVPLRQGYCSMKMLQLQ